LVSFEQERLLLLEPAQRIRNAQGKNFLKSGHKVFEQTQASCFRLEWMSRCLVLDLLVPELMELDLMELGSMELGSMVLRRTLLVLFEQVAGSCKLRFVELADCKSVAMVFESRSCLLLGGPRQKPYSTEQRVAAGLALVAGCPSPSLVVGSPWLPCCIENEA
jgi:hypothetical protein